MKKSTPDDYEQHLPELLLSLDSSTGAPFASCGAHPTSRTAACAKSPASTMWPTPRIASFARATCTRSCTARPSSLDDNRWSSSRRVRSTSSAGLRPARRRVRCLRGHLDLPPARNLCCQSLGAPFEPGPRHLCERAIHDGGLARGANARIGLVHPDIGGPPSGQPRPCAVACGRVIGRACSGRAGETPRRLPSWCARDARAPRSAHAQPPAAQRRAAGYLRRPRRPGHLSRWRSAALAASHS